MRGSPGAQRIQVAPGAKPIVGHALSFARDPLSFLTAIGASAEIVELRFGSRPVVLVCSPELTGQVLMNPRTFDKGGRFFDKVRQAAGNGLATSTWIVHRRHRPLVQPAFHPRRLRQYTEVMLEEIADCTGSWHSGDQVDVAEVMRTFTLRVLVRTMFSAESAAPLLEEFLRAVPIVLRGGFQRMVNPFGWWERIPVPANRRYDAAVKLMRGTASRIIGLYRRSGVDHGDLLSMLLAARDERTGAMMTEEEVVDHVTTLLVAGYETSSSLLSWTCYLMGRHPDVAQRLRDEVDQLFGDGSLDLDTVRSFDYARRVLLETLRLHPSTWILSRATTTGIDLGPYRLPPGTTVLWSPYLLHRRPSVFAEPERFDPERWLPDRAASIPRNAFVPFGAGSRRCIGAEFGLAEATIALVSMTRDWILEPVDDRTMTPVPRLSLATGALPMTVTVRPFRAVT